jgi:hypothetical protein
MCRRGIFFVDENSKIRNVVLSQSMEPDAVHAEAVFLLDLSTI